MMQIIDRIAAIALRPEVKGVMNSMGVKVVSTFSSFLLFSLSARVLGEEQFGQFAMFFSAASMLSVVAIFGQEMLIIRIWSEHAAAGRFGLAKGGIVFGLVISTVGAIAGALLIGIVALVFDAGINALAAALFVFVGVFLLFFSSLARTIISVFAGDGQREITANVPANIALMTAFAFGLSFSVTWLVNLITLGMALGLLYQLVNLNRVLKQTSPSLFTAQVETEKKDWLPRSWKLWFATILESSSQYLDTILIGFLLDPIAAGAYFVASRLANGFASVADAFNMFAMRRFPELYHKNDQLGLTRLLQTLAVITAVTLATGLCVVFFGGQWLLWIFGSEYMAYTTTLLILCLGTAAMAATGPAAPVLMISGGEGSYLRAIFISVFIRLVGFVCIVPFYGVIGAAVATAVSMLVMAVLISMRSKAQTGLNVTITRVISDAFGNQLKTKET